MLSRNSQNTGNEKNTDGQSGEDPKTAAQNTGTPANAKKHKKKKKIISRKG